MSAAIYFDHHAYCTAAPAHNVSPGPPAPVFVLVYASTPPKIHIRVFQIHLLRHPFREIDGRGSRPVSEVVHTIQKEPCYPADPAYLHPVARSEEHTSELQSRGHLVCR